MANVTGAQKVLKILYDCSQFVHLYQHNDVVPAEDRAKLRELAPELRKVVDFLASDPQNNMYKRTRNGTSLLDHNLDEARIFLEDIENGYRISAYPLEKTQKVVMHYLSLELDKRYPSPAVAVRTTAKKLQRKPGSLYAPMGPQFGSGLEIQNEFEEVTVINEPKNPPRNFVEELIQMQ